MSSCCEQLFYSSIRFSMPKYVGLDANMHHGAARGFAIGLGLMNRMLQVLITVGYIAYLTIGKGYEARETVIGSTKSFIAGGGMMELQREEALAAKDASRDSLCRNTTKYWYHNTACNTEMDEPYSCEYNITCTYPEYAEATKKTGEQEVLVFTYMKETMYRITPCSTPQCREGEKLMPGGVEGRCKCWQTRNHFLVGVEEMVLTIRHSFKPFRLLGTRLAAEERSSATVETRVLKGSINGEVLRTFAPGESITASVKDWVAWAGHEIDDVNGQALVDYPSTVDIPGSDNLPRFRMTGIELSIEVLYQGSVGVAAKGGGDIVANIIVTINPGYASFGSDPIFYQDTRSSDGVNGTLELRDRYTRGIRFLISSGGEIGEFSIVQLILASSVLLVYIGFAPTVTEWTFYIFGQLLALRGTDPKKSPMSAFLSYETAVWRENCNQSVSLDGHHATRLMNTLIVRMLFQASGIVTKDRISYHEAEEILTSLLKNSRTSQLAAQETVVGENEVDVLRKKTHVLDTDDVKFLVHWLFTVAHPELKDTPVEERYLSVNRAAILLGGDKERPKLSDCLTHANLDRRMVSRMMRRLMSKDAEKEFKVAPVEVEDAGAKSQEASTDEDVASRLAATATEVRPASAGSEYPDVDLPGMTDARAAEPVFKATT
eukprot:TRINITY_DN15184_c1_g3_i1.p1 TRINITY_DN15184_c1_g3~~TRINITY_DN15184_c1_g3_i1.p1  ORF type:complete len:677 (+),score=99.51 TRINITY_DN15184_c1_g3_i1:50-2032(+)